jgi:hypothetical protein
MSNAWIENHDGRLRIRCRHGGKTRTISLGIEDGKAQRGYALSILGQVKLDLSLNQFDDSLLNYKPKTVGTQATELSCPKLFERYLDHKIERHSSISLAAHSGANLIELSEQTGHSKRTMIKTYLHAVEKKHYFWSFELCVKNNF